MQSGIYSYPATSRIALGSGLRAVKRDPANLPARLDCQLGAWTSIIGSSAGARKGASHGIGHVLGGTAGVPPGYTSCVMLPQVMRFSQPVNGERQKLASEALGRRLYASCWLPRGSAERISR